MTACFMAGRLYYLDVFTELSALLSQTTGYDEIAFFLLKIIKL